MEFLNEISSIEMICTLIEKVVREDNIQQFIESKNEFELVETIRQLFLVFSDKNKRLFYKETLTLIECIIDKVNVWATPYICNMLCDIVDNSMCSKRICIFTLSYLIRKNPNQIKISMPNLIPVISSDINAITKEIKNSSSEALELILR